MKHLAIMLLLLSCCCGLQAQNPEPEIEFANFCGKKINIPKNCVASSDNDIRGCGHHQIQWTIFKDTITLRQSLLKVIKNHQEDHIISEFKAKSFGGTLKGYRMKSKSYEEYTFFLIGVVNNNPVWLTIYSKTDIRHNSDLKSVLPQMLTIEE